MVVGAADPVVDGALRTEGSLLKTITTASVALILIAASAQARTLEVGQGKAYAAPSAAIAAVQDGDTISIYPGQYFDCGVVSKNNVTVQGVGPAEQIVMTDKVCEGKALLVTRGANITVRNLTLTRARVPDENGAGIRIEGPNQVIDHVRFVNNQNGILSGFNGSTITIRDSLFDKNGFCGNACAHGIYIGHSDLVRVEHSVFRETKQAHHIKSRARRTEVIDCDIQDGPTGTASYEIEAPNGGALVVRGTTIEKGPMAENHSAAIVIGSEGIEQPTPEITITNNTFRNDGDFGTAFVNNLTATPAQLTGNHLSGRGPVTPLKGDGQVVAAR